MRKRSVWEMYTFFTDVQSEEKYFFWVISWVRLFRCSSSCSPQKDTLSRLQSHYLQPLSHKAFGLFSTNPFSRRFPRTSAIKLGHSRRYMPRYLPNMWKPEKVHATVFRTHTHRLFSITAGYGVEGTRRSDCSGPTHTLPASGFVWGVHFQDIFRAWIAPGHVLHRGRFVPRRLSDPRILRRVKYSWRGRPFYETGSDDRRNSVWVNIITLTEHQMFV